MAQNSSGSSLWRAWYARIVDRLHYELKRALSLMLLWAGGLGVLALCSMTGLTDYVADLLLDQQAALHELPAPTSGRLPALAVQIDAGDRDQLGPLPWSWSVYEPMLERLERLGVQALLPATSASALFSHDAPPPSSLAAAWIARGALPLPQAVLPGTEQDGERLPQLEPALPYASPAPVASWLGVHARDGVLRRLPFTLETTSGAVPTLGGWLIGTLQPARLPGQNLRLYAPARLEALPQVNFRQLLAGQVPAEQLRQSVVILDIAPALGQGVPLVGARDEQPLSRALPLVLAASQVVSGQTPRTLPYSFPVLLLASLLVGGWMLRQSVTRLMLGTLAVLAGVLLLDTLAYSDGWVLPSAPLLILLLAMAGGVVASWALRIRRLLERFETRLWEGGLFRATGSHARMGELLEELSRLTQPIRPVQSLFLAVPEREMRWLRMVASVGAQESDIEERRRDFGRDPYLTALRDADAGPVQGYMADPELLSWMIPLRWLEELQGFLIVNLRRDQSREAVRLLRALAPQLAQRLRLLRLQERQRRSLRYGEYEEVMEQLESSTRELLEERERQNAVLEQLGAGLLEADGLGNVRFLNSSLTQLLQQLQIHDPHIGLCPLLARLSGQPVASVGKRLERLVFFQEPFVFPIQLKERSRIYRAELKGLFTEGLRDEQSGLSVERLPDGWVLTVLDVTELHTRDRLELMHSRLRDHLTVLQGYAGLLEMADDPASWDKAWISALTDRARELVRFVQQWSLHDQNQILLGRRGEPTDLLSLLEEVVHELDQQRPGRVVLRAPRVGVSPVYIDRERGRRGLQSLLQDFMAGEELPQTLVIRVEEGEGEHQPIFIEHALQGLPPSAAARLLDGLRGERNGSSKPHRLQVAMRLVQEAGGALKEAPELLAEGTVALEFPKV